MQKMLAVLYQDQNTTTSWHGHRIATVIFPDTIFPGRFHLFPFSMTFPLHAFVTFPPRFPDNWSPCAVSL